MVITVVEATKRYGEVLATDRVSLRVEPGEIYALLGLNGAGKTTLIRMLLGMVRPTGGSVALFGTPVRARQREVWSRVGYLVESPSAYPDLTVRENLRLAARLRRLPDGRAVDAVIDRLGLTEYARRRAQTLSLGNAQRLGLAKALLHRPDLLILDEPANGLDPAGVVEIRELLRHLATDDGTTVLLSSHVLGEVARLATRIGIIHRGRMRRELPASDLHDHVQEVLLVHTRDDQMAAGHLREAGFDARLVPEGGLRLTDQRAVDFPDDVAKLLVASGTAPTGLVVQREDLEGFFLRTVADSDGGPHA
jgi:ABC-2 type transport system ATP-binding protein